MSTPKDYPLKLEMEAFIREFAQAMNLLSYIPRKAVTLDKIAYMINPLGDRARAILEKIDEERE
jgi:hypothetical protein